MTSCHSGSAYRGGRRPPTRDRERRPVLLGLEVLDQIDVQLVDTHNLAIESERNIRLQNALARLFQARDLRADQSRHLSSDRPGERLGQWSIKRRREGQSTQTGHERVDDGAIAGEEVDTKDSRAFLTRSREQWVQASTQVIELGVRIRWFEAGGGHVVTDQQLHLVACAHGSQREREVRTTQSTRYAT